MCSSRGLRAILLHKVGPSANCLSSPAGQPSYLATIRNIKNKRYARAPVGQPQQPLQALQLHVLAPRIPPPLVLCPRAIVLRSVGVAGGVPAGACRLPRSHLLQQGCILGLVDLAPNQLQRTYRLLIPKWRVVGG